MERTEDYARALARTAWTRDDRTWPTPSAGRPSWPRTSGRTRSSRRTSGRSRRGRRRAAPAAGPGRAGFAPVPARGRDRLRHTAPRATSRRRRSGASGAPRSAPRATASAPRCRSSGHEQAEALMNVAHELGQPLTALSGNLQLAERAVARGGAAHVRPQPGPVARGTVAARGPGRGPPPLGPRRGVALETSRSTWPGWPARRSRPRAGRGRGAIT